MDNPTYFIDSDGREVFVHGADAKATVTEIQKTTALKLSIDNTGRVTAEW